MKKLIALFLTLILCLGVFVSCASKEKLKEELRDELEAELRDTIESEILAEIEVEEKALREKTYVFYCVEAECAPDTFEANFLYDNYTSFRNVFSTAYEEQEDVIGQITEETFAEYYVLAICVGDFLYSPYERSYNNLRLDIDDPSGYVVYSIDYSSEYKPNIKLNGQQQVLYSTTGYHLVLIPKSEMPAENYPSVFVHKILTLV